ncbi:MAG: hypothetical protein R6U26_00805 [Candidatus Undinarchaeales archaeon]
MAKKRKKSTKKQKKSRKAVEDNKLPRWLIFFSNKIMPPLFFMFIALFSLYFISKAEPIPLKLNLGAIAIISSSFSIYIATLLM